MADLTRLRTLAEKPEDDEAVHGFFELTYANYLVLHRSALQSMPPKWQREFVALVQDMDDRIEWPDNMPSRWCISARDEHGKFMRDPVPHYNRGRTRMEVRADG